MNRVSMSDEDAKKEVDSINEEIAKEKGINTEEKPKEDPAPNPEDKKGDEPADNKDSDGDDKKKDEDVDPKDPNHRDDRVPLSKYQDTKKTLEAKISEKDTLLAEKDTMISKLEEDLKASTTSKQIGDKVKAYAEKHDMTEEAVYDLLNLVKPETPALDPEAQETLKKSAALVKKAEAEATFQSELSTFIAETPEAKDFVDKIRTEAFKEENLDKSLFEIYHRFVKPDAVQKKITGETSRPGRDNVKPAFDVKKIAADAQAGVKGSLDGLSGEQLDEVFAYMDKTGSRYNKSS